MPKHLVKAEFYDTELERNRLPGEEIEADGERLERLRAADVIGREPIDVQVAGGKSETEPKGPAPEPIAPPAVAPEPEAKPEAESEAKPEAEHKADATGRGKPKGR